MKRLLIIFSVILMLFSCSDVTNSGTEDTFDPSSLADEDLLEYLDMDVPEDIALTAPDISGYQAPVLFDGSSYQGATGQFGEEPQSASLSRSIEVSDAEAEGDGYYIFLYNSSYFSYIKESDLDSALDSSVELPPGEYRAMMIVTDYDGSNEYLLGSTEPVAVTIVEDEWTDVYLGTINTPDISHTAPASVVEGSDIQIDLSGDLMNSCLSIVERDSDHFGVQVQGYGLNTAGYTDEDSYYLDNFTLEDDGEWSFTYIGSADGTDLGTETSYMVMGGELDILDSYFDESAPVYIDSDIIFGGTDGEKGLTNYLSLELTESEMPAYIYEDVTGTFAVEEPADEPFVTVWNTSPRYYGCNWSNYIELPLVKSGEYDFTVDWGDGTTSRITEWNQSERLHVYPRSGVYTVSITGTLKGWSFVKHLRDRLSSCCGINYIEYLKIQKVLNWGDFSFENTNFHFSACAYLIVEAEDLPDVGDATNLYGSFAGCCSLTDIPNMDQWDTGNVEYMATLFSSSSRFDQDLSGLDVSSVKSFFGMFFNASSYTNGGNPEGLENWEVQDDAYTTYMFSHSGVSPRPSWY